MTDTARLRELEGENSALRARVCTAENHVERMRAVVEAARALRDDLRLRAQFAGSNQVECGAGVWRDINDALAALNTGET